MKYIKQLDSLRAIAVLLVIISHWLPKSHLLNSIPLGVIGVDIFFVLSGFLITSILFSNKNKEEVSNGKIIKFFYARRVLRIFPIYYLCLFVLLALEEYTNTNIKEDFIYYFTYTTNFNFIIKNDWDGMISHFWSLAVEEQFYLFWPWIIVFTRRKYLFHIISIFIVIGLSSRLIFSEFEWGRILTTSCFDSLGIGAMLAWFVTYKNQSVRSFYIFIRALSILVLINYLLFLIIPDTGYWIDIPEGTTNSIVAAWVISFIYLNKESKSFIFRFLWNNNILIYIGRISYGIYLYHKILPTFSWIIRRKLQSFIPEIKWFFELPHTVFITNFIILIFISSASYRFIESPILRYKRYFKLNRGNSKTLYETN
ncbi:MAG: acyltransferase [Christiangramia sp.]|nr:acyltransferase [Christiangramia sp.]